MILCFIREWTLNLAILQIKDLHVAVEDEETHQQKEILKGVNLKIQTGEIHAIMGPNGTGKSTLSQTIMGQPNYHVTQGDILLNGESILEMPVDERARKGLFLAMQYPAEIQGVTNAEFLRAAMNARRPKDDQISIMDFLQELDQKRNEILQLLMIKPSFAILDEIDSGLDIDALKVVSRGVNSMRGANFGSLIITHYQRLLNYIVPDTVHVMMGGRIVKDGGPELAKKLEAEGYAGLRDELGLKVDLVDEDK